MERPFQNNFQNHTEMKKMNTINVRGIGLLTEEQILTLVQNAREIRTENIILRDELELLKGVSQ